MENKFINRYNTFCKSLSNLSKSKTADPKTDLSKPRPSRQSDKQYLPHFAQLS